MNRRQFVVSSSALLATSVSDIMTSVNAGQSSALPVTSKMPVLFVGHGSPMNAITQNRYHQTWRELGESLPRPSAILVISAHWRSIGVTRIMNNPEPETIHDFFGFPDELYEQLYSAPGSPQAAKLTSEVLIQDDLMTEMADEQGLDHGSWSVLLAMYPKANIPVFQLSIDYQKPASFHYRLGRKLAELRRRGVLIIGSGNMIHNLRARRRSSDQPYDWALELENEWVGAIEDHNDQPVIDAPVSRNQLMKLAHPTLEHFYPLLYTLGAKDKNDQVEFFNQGFTGSSISMRSVVYSA